MLVYGTQKERTELYGRVGPSQQTAVGKVGRFEVQVGVPRRIQPVQMLLRHGGT